MRHTGRGRLRALSPLFLATRGSLAPTSVGVAGSKECAKTEECWKSAGSGRGVFACFGGRCRIACGLLLGHIVSHGLYGNIEGARFTGDQTPGEGGR